MASLSDAPASVSSIPDELPPPPRAPFVMKSAPNGVLVMSLAPGVNFESLRGAIRSTFGTPAVGGGNARFQGATLRLDLGARDVDLFDLRRLIHLLKDEFVVDTVGLHCTTEALHRFAERELKLKVQLAPPMVDELPPPSPIEAAVDEGPTELVSGPIPDDEVESESGEKVLTIDGTVRSGAVVRFAGDIQVFGDVNPGAQLYAGGNVIVFGALKGMACAGCRGDEGAIILAFDLRPTQLRIGKVIHLPRAMSPEREARHASPEIAWISDGSIVTEPYKGRLPSHVSKETP